MLDYAINHKKKLTKELQKTHNNEKFKFYHNYIYCNLKFSPVLDTWEKLQLVSINNKDEIQGYFQADYNRNSNKIDNLSIIIFHKNISSVIDLSNFFKRIYNDRTIHKIEFYCVIGNPAEKLYNRLIKKYNGNIVGILKKSARLNDGKYYDMKLFEIFTPASNINISESLFFKNKLGEPYEEKNIN